MFIIIASLYLFSNLLIFKIIQDKVSKYFILLISSYWFISLLISVFNPFGLFNVSNKIYILLIIDVLSFLIGYLSIKNKFFKLDVHNIRQIDIVSFCKSKIFIYVFIACFITMVYYFIKQLQIILIQNGLGNLKLDIFQMVFGGNNLMYNFYECIVSPMFHIVCLLLAYLLFNYRNNRLIFIFSLYILLYGFIGGKRAYFLTFFFYVLVMFFLSNTYVIKNKLESNYWLKKGTYTATAFSILFSFMIFMSSLTGGIGISKDKMSEYGEDLLKQFVIYSVGPFRAFEIGLNNNYLEEAGGYLFGRASFGGGIDYYSCRLLSYLGFNTISARELTMNKLQNDSIVIGNQTDFNYAYTNAMYHYYDFGIMGIIIIPFFFGFFVRYCIYLFYKEKTVSSMVLIGVCFIACIQMLMFWYFIGIYPIVFVLSLLYLSKKEYKKYKLIPN